VSGLLPSGRVVGARRAPRNGRQIGVQSNPALAVLPRIISGGWLGLFQCGPETIRHRSPLRDRR
jgi:hypothetical protein